MEHILLILVATIAISTIINVLLKRFDIPTVIGYIFTGLISMQIFDFGLNSQETLSHLAEFGIVFLMVYQFGDFGRFPPYFRPHYWKFLIGRKEGRVPWVLLGDLIWPELASSLIWGKVPSF